MSQSCEECTGKKDKTNFEVSGFQIECGTTVMQEEEATGHPHSDGYAPPVLTTNIPVSTVIITCFAMYAVKRVQE